MTKTLTIDGDHLTLKDVVVVANAWSRPEMLEVALSTEAREKVRRSRQAVEEFVARGEVIYGITTGFGAFKDRIIPPDQVTQLQRNIIMSHAVGVGAPLDQATTRALMLIRANTLAKGYSGVRLELLETLLELINQGVHPIVPSQGSLGASGDLAPLAHMSLVLLGEGEAIYQGEHLPGGEAIKRADIPTIELAAKEGLALTNGTAVMCAIGALATYQAENLSKVADIAGCLSLEALHGTPLAFDERIPLRSPQCAGCLHLALHPPGARSGARCYPLRPLGPRNRTEFGHR
jgi:histidine ammonia-lyase